MSTPAPNLACPLCGGANACAPATSGSFGGPCWCETVAFDAELLARVPEAMRGVACVCAACATASTAATAAATSPTVATASSKAIP